MREAAEHARQQEMLRLAAEREAEERRQEVEMLKKQLAAMDDKGPTRTPVAFTLRVRVCAFLGQRLCHAFALCIAVAPSCKHGMG